MQLVVIGLLKLKLNQGITDGKFTEINPLEEIEDGISIVTEGSILFTFKSKMGGEMDSCGH